VELAITLENPDKRVQLFGSADANLRLIREICKVHITARDGLVKLSGTKSTVSQAAQLLELMQQRLKHVDYLGKAEMNEIIRQAAQADGEHDKQQLDVYVHGRKIIPRTDGQAEYIKAIQEHDLVFSTGPAGTGKTYLAVAVAVSMLKKSQIRRIVLARPAVEAGEKLGFLPGDMQAKVNPYLRPLFDALGDMMEYSQIKRFLQNDILEVIPLAFMRGRTLNDSLIILDEAQNTTISQMLMFLTRLGHNSKMVVTGDDSQSDLENEQKSGLVDGLTRLKGIKGVATIRLAKSDIVRHRLVQKIVMAYENYKK
jgi:phosphate starvation-inducible PhoH-like protein